MARMRRRKSGKRTRRKIGPSTKRVYAKKSGKRKKSQKRRRTQKLKGG